MGRLDVAIDLLKDFGPPVCEFFDAFLKRDRVRWATATMDGLQVPKTFVGENDGGILVTGVCYVLLRALARSSVPYAEKLQRIVECLQCGTGSIREAATHALGDMGGTDARNLLTQAAASDADALVREGAKKALDDLES